MVYCRQCGSSNEEGATNCKNCGARIITHDDRRNRNWEYYGRSSRWGGVWLMVLGIFIMTIGLGLALNLSIWNWIGPAFLVLVGVVIVLGVLMMRRRRW